MDDDDPIGAGLDRAHFALLRGDRERARAALRPLAGSAQDQERYWVLATRAESTDPERCTMAERGLRQFPESAALLFHSAAVHMDLGDLDTAERRVLAALQLDPEDADAYCLYARLCGRAGQAEKASALLDRAAALEPESAIVLETRRILADLQADDPKTRAIAREQLARNPDDAWALARTAFDKLGEGHRADARRLLSGALQRDPRLLDDAPHLATELRVAMHPLLWPMWPFQRFGAIQVWATVIGLSIALRAVGQEAAGRALVTIHLCLALYSWIVPPLLRIWYRRQDSR